MLLAPIVACAPTTAEWTAARVDPISVQDRQALQGDLAECAGLAETAYQLAVQQGQADLLRQMIFGAAFGAATGAAIGEAVAGEAGRGAVVGGAAGLHSRSYLVSREEHIRQQAIGGCLRNRGYETLW